MSLYRHLLRSRRSSSSSSSHLRSPAAIYSPVRPFAFSSAEDAAAERRCRIEPPLHAVRRDPSAARPPPDTNGPPPPRLHLRLTPTAPRLPDSTSALVGPRLSLHNQVQTLIRSGNLDKASSAARQAVFSRSTPAVFSWPRPAVFTCNAVVGATLRAKRLNDVVALFTYFWQCNIVPNVVSYNILINATAMQKCPCS